VKRYHVEVLLVTFVELSGVPFLLKACSENCQTKLMEMYGQKNVELQEKLDSEYDESIRQALKEQGMEVSTPQPQHRHRSRRRHHQTHSTRRRKRCSIM
jgi:TRAP-type C4-dicarboxylate transport system substrate-binding protein